MTPALRKTLVAVSRLPVLADRRGMRWLLNGTVMPGGALALLSHRGRRSGRLYTTPVEVLVHDRELAEIVVTPVRGERSDWFRNVLAGGVVGVRLRGESFYATWRRLTEDESRSALTRYHADHPIWGRLIIIGLARSNRSSKDVVARAAKSAPLLVLAITATQKVGADRSRSVSTRSTNRRGKR